MKSQKPAQPTHSAMSYSVEFFDDDVEAGIMGLPDGLVARFVHLAERMELFGANLGMPHTRAMGEGLFEMRLKSAEGIARVFLLHVGGAQGGDASPVCEENRQNATPRFGDCTPAAQNFIEQELNHG